MLNVSSDVKAKFKSDVCRKELKIVVNGVTCTNEDIYKDSFKLTETVVDGKVEFVGCISSILEAKISTLKLPKADYHGCPINASVAVYLDNNTLSSYIPLFNGTVDSCEKSADGHWQTLTCYDILAYLSDTPAYNEYKAAFNGGTVTLANFRSSVMGDLGINEETQTLPNDAVKFKKRYRNKDLTAMALVRHITQINGAFGIINRSGNFEYRWIDDGASPEDIPYYRSLEYSDQTITPINVGLNIRTNQNDAGVTVTRANYQQYVGTDPGWSDDSTDTYLVDDDDEDITNGNYVIESNLIAYKLNKNKKKVLAANIMAKVGFDAVFREYKVVCNGLPYVECCDKVRFTKADGSQIGFVVLKRTLQGVQNMTDTYECAPTQETVQTGSGVSSTASSYVSNVANSTLGMSGSPDEALGLVEKSITVNGTYAATEDGAEGYSQVVVNVDGGVEYQYQPTKAATSSSEDFHPGSVAMLDGKIIGVSGSTWYELVSDWTYKGYFNSSGWLLTVLDDKIHAFQGNSHFAFDSNGNATYYNSTPFFIRNTIYNSYQMVWSSGGKLYAHAGTSSSYSSSSSYIYIWDDSDDSWSRVSNSTKTCDYVSPCCITDAGTFILRPASAGLIIYKFDDTDKTWSVDTRLSSAEYYLPSTWKNLVWCDDRWHIIDGSTHISLINGKVRYEKPIDVNTDDAYAYRGYTLYDTFAVSDDSAIYAGGGRTALNGGGSAMSRTYKVQKSNL